MDQVRRLKELEPENAKLERLVSESRREKLVLQAVADHDVPSAGEAERRGIADSEAHPQEAELRTYLQSHIDKFRLAPLISFRQIFVSTRRGDAAEPDARQILSRLVADTSLSSPISNGTGGVTIGVPVLFNRWIDLRRMRH